MKRYLFILLLYPILFFAQNELKSSILPIISINTENQIIQDDDRITCFMGIINSEGFNNINDDYNDYSGRISIEHRGVSSMLFPKKAYSIETQDSLGNNNNISLLGMPEENDWVLYAPYGDKSYFRNVLTYNLYEKMGYYSPRFRFCDLYVNNEYKGVYVLIEKIKRDKNRVNINEQENINDLSGGYILQVDRASSNSDKYWTSSFNDSIYFQYIYPKWSKINYNQKQYIQEYIHEFEQLLFNSQPNNLSEIYSNVINISSFVDYFIISELSKNIDAYRLSTYLYKDHKNIDNRLNIGPIWDFNWAYGNTTYCEGDLFSGWEGDGPCGVYNPFWYSVFRADSTFNNFLKCRWIYYRNDFLNENYIFSFIDSLATNYSEEINKDMLHWGHSQNTSHDFEINKLKNWISQRINWIDNNIEGLCQQNQILHNPKLIYVTDILGNILYDFSQNKDLQHLNYQFLKLTNKVIFLIYDDSSVEKKIIFDKY